MTAVPDFVALTALLGRSLSDSERVVAVASYLQGQAEDRDFWVGQGMLRVQAFIEKEVHGG